MKKLHGGGLQRATVPQWKSMKVKISDDLFIYLWFPMTSYWHVLFGCDLELVCTTRAWGWVWLLCDEVHVWFSLLLHWSGWSWEGKWISKYRVCFFWCLNIYLDKPLFDYWNYYWFLINHYSCTVLETKHGDLFLDCLDPVGKCLKDTKLDRGDIDDIILVGGSISF